jgi:hypothetical protein
MRRFAALRHFVHILSAFAGFDQGQTGPGFGENSRREVARMTLYFAHFAGTWINRVGDVGG